MFPEPTLAAVFLTGLLGGVHCAGMCGGIVSALAILGGKVREPLAAQGVTPRGVPPRGAPHDGGVIATIPLRFMPDARPVVAVPVPPRRVTVQLAYNAGRLSSYTLLGAAAGAAGSFGWLYGEALPLQQMAFAVTNVLLVLMGLYVAGATRIGHLFERPGVVVWRRLRPVATASLARASSDAGAFFAGAVWGLVPCGMVYAVLAGALLAGSPANGAALMLAFGLGTLPNLLLLGFSAGRVGRLLRRPRVRLGAGVLIAAFGVFGLLRLDAARHIPLLGELCVRLPPLSP